MAVILSVQLLAHRAWHPPPSSSLAKEKNAFARSSSVRRRAISDARSGVVELLAHRAWESAAVVVTREGKERRRSLLLRAAARDFRRSQRCC
jgi:hypothetical protein